MCRNATGPKFEGSGNSGQKWAHRTICPFLKDGEERRMES